MKNLFLLVFLSCLLRSEGFKEGQLQHERVKLAYLEKHPGLELLLRSKHLSYQGLQIYLRAFKNEKTLEVWARNNPALPYKLLTSYDVCARSGTFGPKRQEGDGQIPEGFYVIDRFNPQSLYYLSLGIDYPNAADKIKGKGKKLGGDIFVHGDCVTVGCLPLTDDKIKELYVLAVEAYGQGQTQIPVHIFPTRFNSSYYTSLKAKYSQNHELLSFWANLENGFSWFENHKTLPQIEVNSAGMYTFR